MQDHKCLKEGEFAKMQGIINTQNASINKDVEYMKKEISDISGSVKEIRELLTEFVESVTKNYISKEEYEKKCKGLEASNIELKKAIENMNLKIAFFSGIFAVIMFFVNRLYDNIFK